MSSTSHHRRRSSLVGTSDSFASSTSLRTPSLGLSASNSFVNSTTAAAACRSYTESTGRITRTTNDVKSTCCLLDRLLQSRFPTNLPTEYTFEYPSKLNCITAHETFEQQHDWPLSLRQLQQTWRLNYQEAAIYLQEGANNEKHAQHPANHMQMHFYHLVHHPIYKFLDICSAIALICVTAIENPGSSLPQLSHNCRLSVELGILILITILIWLKYKWMGASCFFAHRRSCLKAFSLLAMLGEIALMYFRQKVHIRPWRALRILFLIDCSQFDQTRRSFRHFLTSLPNACHVLVAMLLLLINFALIGHFLFYDSPKFESVQQAFYRLLYCIGGSSFMDTMMSVYSRNKISVLYFVCFLIVEVYFLFHVLLALIYHAFYQEEESKMSNLEHHWRRYCSHAFQLLTTCGRPKELAYAQFRCVIQHLHLPQQDELGLFLRFKLMDRDLNGFISQDEFHALYELRHLRYEQVHPASEHCTCLARLLFKCGFGWPRSLRTPSESMQNAGKLVVRLMLAFAFTIELIQASSIQISRSSDPSTFRRPLIVLYCFELLFKLAFSVHPAAFVCKWNVYDTIVTLLSVYFEFLVAPESYAHRFSFIHVLRAVRFLTLFHGIKKFNDMVGAMLNTLLRELLHVAFFVFCVLFIFSVLGVELFGQATFIQSGSTQPIPPNQLLLNCFEDFLTGFVSLFFLMCGSSYFYLSEHYVSLFGASARIYFIVFFLFAVLLANIVMCVMIEFIIFQIKYRTELKQHGQDLKTGHIKQISVSVNELRTFDLIKFVRGLSGNGESEHRVSYSCHDQSIQTSPTPSTSSLHSSLHSSDTVAKSPTLSKDNQKAEPSLFGVDSRYVVFHCWPEMDKFAMFRLINSKRDCQ